MALAPPQEFTAKQQPISPNELPLVQRESRPQHDQEEPKAERVEREALNPNAKSRVPFHDGEIDRKPRLKSFENDSNHASAAGLALLPVKVKVPGLDKIVETYAFLDHGSNTSFCSEGLIEELGINGRATTLSLTTMESKNTSIKYSAVDLEVMDLKEETLVELPQVFTRPHLPVTVENAANQGDVDRWPHLAGIIISKIDANVGLLIGNDAPKILHPKEVRESSHKGPVEGFRFARKVRSLHRRAPSEGICKEGPTYRYSRRNLVPSPSCCFPPSQARKDSHRFRLFHLTSWKFFE